jgi:hypothetical protein
MLALDRDSSVDRSPAPRRARSSRVPAAWYIHAAIPTRTNAGPGKSRDSEVAEHTFASRRPTRNPLNATSEPGAGRRQRRGPAVGAGPATTDPPARPSAVDRRCGALRPACDAEICSRGAARKRSGQWDAAAAVDPLRRSSIGCSSLPVQAEQARRRPQGNDHDFRPRGEPRALAGGPRFKWCQAYPRSGRLPPAPTTLLVRGICRVHCSSTETPRTGVQPPRRSAGQTLALATAASRSAQIARRAAAHSTTEPRGGGRERR